MPTPRIVGFSNISLIIFINRRVQLWMTRT